MTPQLSTPVLAGLFLWHHKFVEKSELVICRLLWEYLTILGSLHVVKAVTVIRAISWEAPSEIATR